MLTFIHMNPVVVRENTLYVDRKFHLGMMNYVKAIRGSIATVNPLGSPGQKIMDSIQLPIDSLPYKLIGIELDRTGRAVASSVLDLETQIARSDLVVGYGYGTHKICKRLGKPYIACLEYDLQTQLTVAVTFANGPVRKAWAGMKCLYSYLSEMIPAMRSAIEIHCNGYPVFIESARYNSNRLLYLDSRITEETVVSEHSLERRLTRRSGQRLRLIYSGRYEAMKGTLDAVRSVAYCIETGINVELDCFGMGALEGSMRSIARRFPDRIRIHGPIPFHDLVERTKHSDVFICCHIQGDPSCTYLEAMGCGVPIVGYANSMWASLQKASLAGVAVKMHSLTGIRDAVAMYQSDPTALATASRNARNFCLAHTFEKEFRKRTDRIQQRLSCP